MSSNANLSPFAGKLPEAKDLIDLDLLLKKFDQDHPDVANPAQRVSFGTSGHRGSSFETSFNRDHIWAMSQAICSYRKQNKIDGPLFLGLDTHALSRPAFAAALEVFAANEVEVMIDQDLGYTPTPVISHAILNYNLGRTSGLADGVVITPSHNPPQDGGFKYNPTHGGPAGKDITDWIEKTANQHLESKLTSVLRIPYERALKAACVHRFDFVNTYVKDLDSILDFDVIRHSDIKLAVDPLGGAGVDYWQPIADRYKINLQVLNKSVDPTFKFMARDWDGKIRMDPSSQYVMSPLLEQRKNFDVAFACDTDHDRHGIVTKSAGLMQANHYLATCIAYLYRHRPQWPTTLKIGKTLVSSQIIDRVAKMIEREVYEVPVGFKWFVDGLTEGTLGFVGEESAGSTFLRKDGRVWTTDKDSFVPSLLAGEMTARLGKDPGELYKDLTEQLGSPVYARVDSPASAEEKKRVTSLNASKLMGQLLGGDKITAASNKAKSNGAAIGGFKLETENGWVAARPSGTEDILKIYGESFKGNDHLQSLFSDVKKIVGG